MFNVASLRHQFPALQRFRGGRCPIFLDGPGGTQVPQRVIDAVVAYLTTCNANHGGVFATSRESDRVVAAAHEAAADLINAPAPEEIAFGANMTTLTLHLSRSIGRTLRPGDEVIVTRLDHDANVSPWVLAARDAGATVRHVDIHPEDCTLDVDDLRRQLGPHTRLVAVGCASNAVGTVNDVRAIARWAHAVGARVFLDAVHYAPHGPIDVQEWDCDFLACSAYKFFGPHVGVLWGRRELLEELPAYKLRAAPETLPDRWMTGTQNHEGLAGAAAAVDYLAGIGAGDPAAASKFPALSGRRLHIRAGLVAIQGYEAELGSRLLAALVDRPRFTVWGIKDRARLAWRVPTVSITMKERTPRQMAEHLAERDIYTWDGNMYALALTERLDLEERGGLLRIGLVHYNTAEEVDRLIEALDELL
ncbi:MAG TPA: cysteine desulfurase-like protein [Gemmataceae bacterium]|jgi:cysteine desulfurase family protein (TIGR01976 family)|nr:cysteine desulfurase-like protein [Gemmataceae bacterium]